MKNTTPQARNENIVVQNLKGEVLLYDLKINRAYCLNETAALVYHHCDGKTSFDELRRKSGRDISDEVIWLAIEELNRLNLLAEKAESDLSRRSLLQKAAVSAVALPLITMLVAPRAIQASSSGTDCTPDGQPTTNPQDIDGASQSTCLGAGYADATCCSGTASGEFAFFGVCFTETCGAGPGCVSPGGANDSTLIGSANVTNGETCQTKYASQCCSGRVAQYPLQTCSNTPDGTVCDCRCGTFLPL